MTKRVCRDWPIPNCGAKYLVRLSDHLTDVHVLDYINRRKWLQEAELQPKVRMMIYQAKRNQGLRPSTSETPLSVDEEEKDTIVHHLSKPRGQCEVRWRSERVAVAPVFTSNFHKKPNHHAKLRSLFHPLTKN